MTEDKKTRLLLVEDDKNLGSLLCEFLNAKDFDADLATDGELGFAKFGENQYDLCLLDVMMPIKDGFTLAKEIRQVDPEIPIIFLTAKSMKQDTIEGFKAGADDYISKPFSLRELMVRVEAVLRRSGKNPEDEEIDTLGIHFDGKNLIASKGKASVELTRREMDIVSHLYRNKDRIVSKKELLKDVWEYSDANIETRTVDIHILKLRKKIASLIGDIPAIQTIRGEGYRLEFEE